MLRGILLIMLIVSVKLASATQLHYVANQGQWPEDVKFSARTSEGNINLGTSSISVIVTDATRAHQQFHDGIAPADLNYAGHLWKMNFIGSHLVEPTAVDSVHTTYNYYQGNDSEKWQTHVRASAKVVYKNLYDHIDLIVYSLNGNFKYDFKVHPGADPSQIKWSYEGITPTISEKGELLFKTSWKTFIEKTPISYHLNNTKFSKVSSHYTTLNGIYSFQLGAYDVTNTLTIDPELIFSTNFSVTYVTSAFSKPNLGSFICELWGGVYDSTPGALDMNDFSNALGVTHLSADGQTLEWAATIGGDNNFVLGYAMEVHNNKLYIVGTVAIHSPVYFDNFPVTENAYQSSVTGPSTFMLALNLEGDELIHSTVMDTNEGYSRSMYFSFNPFDNKKSPIYFYNSYSIDFNNGNMLVGMVDNEQRTSFNPLTQSVEINTIYPNDPYFTTGNSGPNNDQSLAVFSITEDLSTMNWIHLINSSPTDEEIIDEPNGNILRWINDDGLSDILMLSNGTLAVSGISRYSSMPTTSGVFQPEWGEETTDTLAQDAWLGIIDPANGAILHASYLGGSMPDDSFMLEEATDGDILMLGRTMSPELTPINDEINVGHGNIYIAKIAPDLSQINRLARIGTTDDELQDLYPMSIGVDSCGRVLIGLRQWHNGSGVDKFSWPLTQNAVQDTGRTYIALLDKNLTRFHYASMYGGFGIHSGKSKDYEQGAYFHTTCGSTHMSSPYSSIDFTNEVSNPNFLVAPESNITLFQFDMEAVEADFSYELLNECTPVEASFNTEDIQANTQWIINNDTLTDLTINYQFDSYGQVPVKLIVTREESCNYSDTLEVVLEIPLSQSALEAEAFFPSISPCELPQVITANVIADNYTDITWTLPDGSTSSEVTQVNFTAENPGLYEVSLQVNDAVCDSVFYASHSYELFSPLSHSWETTLTELDYCQGAFIDAQFTGAANSYLEWYVNEELVSDETSFHQEYYSYQTVSLELTAASIDCNTEQTLTETFVINASSISENEVRLPNAFSPNGDDLNQYFRLDLPQVHSADFKSFSINIFNRWGTLIYSSKSPNFKWDGSLENSQDVHPGVFFFNCSYQLTCGDTASKNLSGTVTVFE